MYATRPSFAALGLLAAATVALPAMAEEPRYNQISLRAEVSSEVAHDRMHVTLYNETQHNDPTQLAAETSKVMNEALARARKVEGVTVSLGSRNSYPVYEEKGQQITAWRERAELRLEGSDFAALSKLTGELMNTLKMGSMQFSVSDGIRKQNEDALLKDAITAFRARAQLATEALGGRDYKVVSLNLDSNGYQPVMMRSVAMKSSRMEDSIAPEIEAGTRQVTMNANGVIEVLMP